MSELLPCPFCQGSADTWSENPENLIVLFLARCNKCGAQIPARTSQWPLFKTEAEAIEAWNRRAEPSAAGEPMCPYCSGPVHMGGARDCKNYPYPPRPDDAGVRDLIDRLHTEADLCRNETATDIADLLDEAAKALSAHTKEASK